MRALLLATVSLIGLTTSAFAASSEDAAYSKHNRPVYDSRGKCVRTQWQLPSDPCAPAEPVKHVVVEKIAPTTPVANITLEQRSVYFAFNSAKLTGEGTSKLDQLAEIINRSSEITEVSIHGFTDQIGSDSYNTALAHKRAKVVKAYLDSKSRLKSTEGDVRGLGKATPEEGCAAIKKRAAKITCMNKERRVEVEFKAQE